MTKASPIVVLHNVISPHVTPVFQALAKLTNLEVVYCAETEVNRSWHEKPKGFSYRVLPHSAITLKGKDVFTYFINPTVIATLRELKPQLVVISGWDLFSYQVASLYCWLADIPYLLWSGSTKFEPSWRRSLAQPLVELMIQGASGYLAYGSRAKEYLVELGADPEHITIAYNSTISHLYTPAKAQQKAIVKKLAQRHQLEGKTVILFYGQLIQRKGVDLLIQAFSRLKPQYPQLSLLIIGSGPERSTLEQWVVKEQLTDIQILDDPGDKKMVAYFQMSHIVVLPSREEVWGLVVNQAMHVGLPVVVSDRVGAGSDLVIEGQTGFTFPTESVKVLADKLSILIENKKLRTLMGEQAKSRVKIATPEKAASSIYQAIRKVVE